MGESVKGIITSGVKPLVKHMYAVSANNVSNMPVNTELTVTEILRFLRRFSVVSAERFCFFMVYGRV